MSATLLTNRPLAASESFTQAIRDRFNDREPIGAVRALVYADKAGTLYLEESDDEGAHYAAAATVSVSAATTTELAWTALTKRWYRFRYANSTTAQTNFRLIQQTRGLDVHKVDIGDSVTIESADISIDTEAITGAGSAAKTLADVVTAIAAIDVEAITGAGAAAKTLADIVTALGSISLDAEDITGAGELAKTLADVVDAINGISISTGDISIDEVVLADETIEAITGAGEAAKTLADIVTALSGIATAAKQDTLIAKDFATQTTLAAVLAKIIAAPATEAKQDSIITLLQGLSRQTVTECQDQDDADNNVLTFSDDIYALEIYHNEDTAQEFTANGLTLTIAPGGWRSPIGGTPAATVTIPAGVDCIVSRLV